MGRTLYTSTSAAGPVKVKDTNMSCQELFESYYNNIINFWPCKGHQNKHVMPITFLNSTSIADPAKVKETNIS